MKYLCLVFVLLCLSQLETPVADELQALQGTWVLEELHKYGVKHPEEYNRDTRIRFEGDIFVLYWTKNDGLPYKITLPPKESPRHIDLVGTGKQNLGRVRLGAYSLEGDKLVLCLNLSQENVRPKDVKTELGDRNTLFKLKRVPAK